MTEIIPLQLSDSETFPPLKALSLSGYEFGENEFPYWRDKCPWDQLQSLSLGPDDNDDFLERITGYMHCLTELTITSYCRRDKTRSPELDRFLQSFDTLKSLSVKGFLPSVDAVTRHSRLEHLCLHAIEHPERDRPTLTVEELRILDQSCPNLRSLEIDVDHKDTWVSAG